MDEQFGLLPRRLVDAASEPAGATRFFRDPAAWQALESLVLPRLLRRRQDRRLRIWCSGPHAQADALSALILVTQIIRPDAVAQEVQIFATDPELRDGHPGLGYDGYTSDELQVLPTRQRQACFVPVPGHWTVRPELREVVVSGRHDPARQAPFTNIDLLISSLPLEGHAAPTLTIVLNRLHFALAPGGCLVVDREHERLLRQPGLFKPVHAGSPIFAKVGRVPVQALRPEMIDIGPAPARGSSHQGAAAQQQAGLQSESSHALNVELHALVDQLQAQNQRLQRLSEELALSNARQASELCTLRSGLAKVTAALRVLPDPVLVLGGDGRVIACSAAAAALLGHRPDELEDQPPEQLFDGPVALDDAAADGLRCRHRDGHLYGRPVETTALHVGGQRCWLLRLAPPAPGAGGGLAEARSSLEWTLPSLPDLTPRERDVLSLLLQGQQSKQIAHTLKISRRTVDVHRGNLARKTGARSLAELLRLAISDGSGLRADAGRADRTDRRCR